ncbi:EAL domain-containing protein [Hyphomonas sp. FCG-A18]|uniref:EAL domain-containing protein n=1 Tax=Hyphomonas sp. FCG-A18 TaxID=3080019 RepID=UPI002B28C4C0|nr:EAL domain-containing protein [Hyphomonas sp. FCG-A18]
MSSFSDHKKLLDELPYPVFAKNERHQLIYGNQAFASLIGRDDFIGLSDQDLFPEHQAKEFWAQDQRVLAGEESINEEQIGNNVLALTRKVPINFRDGRAGVFGMIVASAKGEDFSTLQETYEENLLRLATMTRRLKERFKGEIEALQNELSEVNGAREAALVNAQTDIATGLRNRAGLSVDLESAIEKYHREGTRFGLSLLDLDSFKRVNDRFGHEVGDLVLKVIGKRLWKLPFVASVARMGGDEFAIITELPNVEGVDVERELERARAYVFRPIDHGTKRIPLSGSLGVSIYPDDAQDSEALNRHADAALLAAKRGGKGRIQIFDAAIQKAKDRRLQIENSLNRAIPDRDIDPSYQPIVAADGHAVAGVEVLARWSHDELGEVPPEEFIEIAHDAGLLSDLDQAVRERAFRETADWIANGLISYVSVNVSPTDIISRGFATSFLASLKRSAIAPDAVMIEITESSIINDVGAAVRNLQRLHEAGVKIALDDFGTGFSNLRALLDLPLDRLKIDRTLIQDIAGNERLRDMIGSIIQLGRILGVEIIAEGIETEVQSDFIERAGCHYMQGYRFGRPMSAKETDCYLRLAIPVKKSVGLKPFKKVVPLG